MSSPKSPSLVPPTADQFLVELRTANGKTVTLPVSATGLTDGGSVTIVFEGGEVGLSAARAQETSRPHAEKTLLPLRLLRQRPSATSNDPTYTEAQAEESNRAALGMRVCQAVVNSALIDFEVAYETLDSEALMDLYAPNAVIRRLIVKDRRLVKKREYRVPQDLPKLTRKLSRFDKIEVEITSISFNASKESLVDPTRPDEITVRFEQVFRGYKGARIEYCDVTQKQLVLAYLPDFSRWKVRLEDGQEARKCQAL